MYCTGNTSFHKFILNMGLLLQLPTVLSTFTTVNLLLSRTKDKSARFHDCKLIFAKASMFRSFHGAEAPAFTLFVERHVGYLHYIPPAAILNQQNNFHDKSLFKKNNAHVKSTCCRGLNLQLLVSYHDEIL